ncbi:AAA family ATPase [Chloroflexota bacterium]
MKKIIAIVGMAGSGKSEAAKIFQKKGYPVVRFGDLTDREVAARGLPLTEANERTVREQLRREHGMAAYALLNIPGIDKKLKNSDVVVDGLYSWEEYILLKENYQAGLVVIAVWSAPQTRYQRLDSRGHRGRSAAESQNRDYAEIEQVNKGGPIAMADYTICNEGSMAEMEQKLARIIGKTA